MHTNRIRRFCVHAIGWSIIVGVIYVCLCLLLFVLAINLSRPASIFPLLQYQRYYYFAGGRNIWQYDGNCAVADDELIYKPRDGACHFTNMEFDTTLHFDAKGRYVPARMQADVTLPGIAVLGDSHAMGWGVEDEETFANILQQNTSKPVFNLGVSSYGTERELKRLALSEVANAVDTVFILYHGNDLGENLLLKTQRDYAEANSTWAEQVQRGEGPASYDNKIEFITEAMTEILVNPVVLPLRRLASWAKHQIVPRPANPPPDAGFARHIGPLREVIGRYQGLLNGKKVYVGYVAEGGARYDNYPPGKDTELPNVTFLEPSLAPVHFFRVDDHLNAAGHRQLGEWLASVLVESGGRVQ